MNLCKMNGLLFIVPMFYFKMTRLSILSVNVDILKFVE